MSVRENTILAEDTVEAVLQEYQAEYNADYDRLEEVVGLFGVETVNAGTALYKYNVTGTLNNDAPDPDAPEKGSSGTGYVEGDFIKRSHFKVEKTPIGEVEWTPYAIQVTAQEIQKGGLGNGLTRAVNKAKKQIRGDVVTKMFGFFESFDTPTKAAPAAGGNWSLQEMLAYTEGKLLDTLESKNESDTDIVHFVNRADAYEHLADAQLTTQELFGLTYLENFLGVSKVFLTNKVAAGTMYATPVANIRVYGTDYGTLAQTELAYQSDDMGLTGFAYKADYDYASAIAYLVRSMTIMPEVADFIAKGSKTHLA
jgi:hypothetical protein